MDESAGGDQLRQRRDNLNELKALGGEVYPSSFCASTTVSSLVEEHGDKDKESLDAGVVDDGAVIDVSVSDVFFCCCC